MNQISSKTRPRERMALCRVANLDSRCYAIPPIAAFPTSWKYYAAGQAGHTILTVVPISDIVGYTGGRQTSMCDWICQQ